MAGPAVALAFIPGVGYVLSTTASAVAGWINGALAIGAVTAGVAVTNLEIPFTDRRVCDNPELMVGVGAALVGASPMLAAAGQKVKLHSSGPPMQVDEFERFVGGTLNTPWSNTLYLLKNPAAQIIGGALMVQGVMCVYFVKEESPAPSILDPVVPMGIVD